MCLVIVIVTSFAYNLLIYPFVTWLPFTLIILCVGQINLSFTWKVALTMRFSYQDEVSVE